LLLLANIGGGTRTGGGGKRFQHQNIKRAEFGDGANRHVLGNERGHQAEPLTIDYASTTWVQRRFGQARIQQIKGPHVTGLTG